MDKARTALIAIFLVLAGILIFGNRAQPQSVACKQVQLAGGQGLQVGSCLAATPTSTFTGTPTSTFTPGPTSTGTPTFTPTFTATPTATPTPGLTFVGRTQSNNNNADSNVTCSLSNITGAASGDMVIAIIYVNNPGVGGAGSTPGTPSGLTSLGTATSQNPDLVDVYWGIATSSSQSFTWSSNNYPKCILRDYHPNASAPTPSIDSNLVSIIATTTSVTSVTVPSGTWSHSTAVNNEIVISGSNTDGGNITNSTGDLGNATADTTQYTTFDGDKLYTTAATTPNQESFSDSSGAAWNMWFVTIEP